MTTATAHHEQAGSSLETLSQRHRKPLAKRGHVTAQRKPARTNPSARESVNNGR